MERQSRAPTRSKRCDFMKYVLFTDGGSRNNPGQAAIGGVLLCGRREVASFSQAIGIATNNIAEYEALLRGVQLALEHNVRELDCKLDSQLVVEQLNRRYRLKDQELARHAVRIWNLAANS